MSSQGSSIRDFPTESSLCKIPHPLFTELFELHTYTDGYQEWKEISRWIKYKEDVEEEGHRWSKPHVPTPSIQGWIQLRKNFSTGFFLLDLVAHDLGQICDAVINCIVHPEQDFNKDHHFPYGESSQESKTKIQCHELRDIWMLKHRHQFEGSRKTDESLKRVIKTLITQKLETKAKLTNRSQTESLNRRQSIRKSLASNSSLSVDHPPSSKHSRRERRLTWTDDGKFNVLFQKKIPTDCEAFVILEGITSVVENPLSVFVRLSSPISLNDLPEVDIPTRFLYFHMIPEQSNVIRLMGVGDALGTAISDPIFAESLFKANESAELLNALDVYTSHLKLLPPSFDTQNNRIEPPSGTIGALNITNSLEEIDEDRRMREKSGLVRTGRLFGGLLNDIRRKRPFYLKDFFHGFHSQCISSFLFLYFACLTPIIAFGGLLGEATENRIATIESLVSGLISSVLFGLFAGQPLIILGSTGPVYVFEKIMYQMCLDQNWDYLSLRLWIGIWIGAMLILLVALDASAIVCFITRFTEEIFATLIAFIFIVNAFKNLLSIGQNNKLSSSSYTSDCYCMAEDSVVGHKMNMTYCTSRNGTLLTDDCDNQPNVFLMSVVLFASTFTLASWLKNFRNTGYLPGFIRNILSDFAIIITIVLMTVINYFSGVSTPMLTVPSSFKPTWEGRDWVVTHALIFTDHILSNPWWVDVFLAPVLALLGTILIFMDQQITAVIVNRKENKLKKGGGYHLDLLVLSIIIIICSVFGLPWFVAATVLSINHIQSLSKESESTAPGVKPHFLGIREQRVTSVLIGVAIGLSTMITPILAMIPMPVLFGVFLFMGVSSLKGLQFFDRIKLFFVPQKYHKDFFFLKYVPLNRVHLFTLVQLISLITLWIIKSHSTTSIGFPIMLVFICAIRKLIECIFKPRELRVLDDLLPEVNIRNKRRRNNDMIPKIVVQETLDDIAKSEREKIMRMFKSNHRDHNTLNVEMDKQGCLNYLDESDRCNDEIFNDLDNVLGSFKFDDVEAKRTKLNQLLLNVNEHENSANQNMNASLMARRNFLKKKFILEPNFVDNKQPLPNVPHHSSPNQQQWTHEQPFFHSSHKKSPPTEDRYNYSLTMDNNQLELMPVTQEFANTLPHVLIKLKKDEVFTPLSNCPSSIEELINELRAVFFTRITQSTEVKNVKYIDDKMNVVFFLTDALLRTVMKRSKSLYGNGNDNESNENIVMFNIEIEDVHETGRTNVVQLTLTSL